MSKDKSAPPKKENSGSLSILVAEADSELRDSVIDFLNRHNYHAVAQADGAKALAAITKEHFDLAIISLEISSKNGIEVLAGAIETAGRQNRDYCSPYCGFNCPPEQNQVP